MPEVADLTHTDNIHLDTLGDKKTALFVIIPSSDATFNFLAAMMYTQLFDTLYDTANFKYGGRLPVHVRCLLDEFANIGTIPDFDKLLATMRSMEISANIIIQNLAQLKKMYPSNVNVNNRVVVYDIKDLGKQLKPLGMMVVLENLWDKIVRNRERGIRTRIYIDEIYLLFRNEESANFLFELYKRARKWGGIPTGITQNVEDLLKSDTARSMLSNSEFILMLNQAASDRDQLARLLKIPETMMSFVTGAPAGSGLIYCGLNGSLPFKDDFPTDTKLYRLMTTKFGE